MSFDYTKNDYVLIIIIYFLLICYKQFEYKIIKLLEYKYLKFFI